MKEKWVIILIVFALFPSLLVMGCVDPIVGKWENKSITPKPQLEFTSDNYVIGLETLPSHRVGIETKSIGEATWSKEDSSRYYIYVNIMDCHCEGMSPEGNYSDTNYAGPCISFRPSLGMDCGITHGAISYELIYETNPETLTLLINPHNNFTELHLFRIS